MSEKDQIRLLENERRLREAEKLAKMGSWELDLVNDKLYWSDEIYRIFETEPQSFGATYEAFLSFVHPDDRQLINDEYQRSLKEMDDYGPVTHRLITKSGAVKFVEERGYNEYDSNGKPIRSLGIVQDITDRVLGQQTMAKLKEKEILLKEIYHRVKNNLQLVSSLIAIQASQIDDQKTKDLFNTCINRINTISLIHQQLYQSKNLANIQLKQHLEKLIRNIKRSLDPEDKVQFNVSVLDASIPMNEAIPYGLILNEIITNSFKHAFGDDGGVITIELDRNGDQWTLIVADNGKGVENIETLTKSSSFGNEIISSLVDQLDGQMTVESEPGSGVKYTIIF